MRNKQGYAERKENQTMWGSIIELLVVLAALSVALPLYLGAKGKL